MFLINSELVHGRPGAIVSGLNDEEVHAEQDGDKYQSGDTKSRFERDVLDDGTSDCLSGYGSVHSLKERDTDIHTQEERQKPAYSPRLRYVYRVGARSTYRRLWR